MRRDRLWRLRVMTAAAVCAAACMTLEAGAATFQGEEIKVGDIVKFGTYEQDNNTDNGKEAIRWKVLEVDEDDKTALLLSEDCLDTMCYNIDPQAQEKAKKVTWEDSSIRKWLNQDVPGNFYWEAFSKVQQKKIAETKVTADKNGHFKDADPGKETKDRVFLLSEDEVKEYLESKGERIAMASKATAEKLRKPDDEDETEKDSETKKGLLPWFGRKTDGEDETETEEEETEGEYHLDTQKTTGGCFWWLRTPGEDNTMAECVGAEGSVVESGYLVNQLYFGVRPAIRVEIK